MTKTLEMQAAELTRAVRACNELGLATMFARAGAYGEAWSYLAHARSTLAELASDGPLVDRGFALVDAIQDALVYVEELGS